MTYEQYIYFDTKKTNGKQVLKNKLGIFDSSELSKQERIITEINLANVNAYPKGKFDKAHFVKFHKYLFGDIYPFAGEFKKWDLGKGQEVLGGYSVRYCPVQYIESSIDDCCNKLKALKKETPINELAKQIADNWAYLWQTHAFYEGNTRTTALFMTELLKSKGIEFNKEVMARSYHDFRNALVLYTIQKEDKLNSLILEGLQPVISKEIKKEGDNIMNESKKPGNPIKLPKTSKEYNDYIVNMFLEQLNQPPEEWVRGWVYASNQPKNGLSGRKYTGINSFVLSMYMASQQTSDPRFYTAGQVFGSDRKITVNKGEKAAVVISTYLFKYKDLSDGLIHLQHFEKLDEYLNKPELYEVLPPEKRIAIKYTVLYHAKQLSGIEPYKEVQREERQLDPFVAEALKAMNIPLYENIRARCPYFTESGGEKICIPPMKNFVGQEQLDSALLHELIHATGTEKRLNRDTLKNYFVSTDIRAKEELVAELGAVFALQETNVKVTKPADIKNHVSYVQSWKNHIQEKNGIEYLKEAINKAQEASNYLCGLTLERIKAKEEQNRENKSNYCMLMETLKYSEKHILDCGVEIERADGGLCYKQDGKRLYVVFSPTTKKEDSCKLVAEEGFPNHYRIPVIARDVKDWDLIDKEIWKCLDESKYKEHENNKERER